MAAHDIKKHFKGLYADTGRRKGRRDPFATGFEDDSDEESRQRRSRSKTQQAPAAADSRPLDAAKTPSTTTSRLPTVNDLFRDSEDEFLDPPKRPDRRPSPAPNTLPWSRVTDGAGRRGSVDAGLLPKNLQARAVQVQRDPRSAKAQAAGNLAFLDDSSSEEELAPRPRRSDRYPSPAPRQQGDRDPLQRSSTPRGTRDAPTEPGQGAVQPPRHSVASPFAGTKYLQDSDSDSDNEEALALSQTTSLEEVLSDHHSSSPVTIKRVDKPKAQNGGGVSWRAFSEGRAEQRNQEIEALQARLKQRGKSISFRPHALTDDGTRVPLQPSPEQILVGGRGRRKGSRGKSPPRRAEDVKPTEDELADGSGLGIYDPSQFKTNPFSEGERSAMAIEVQTTSAMVTGPQLPPMPSLTSGSTLSPTSDVFDALSSTSQPDEGGLENSISSLTSKAVPQTIHEGVPIETPMSPVLSPMEYASPISRDPSTKSLRSYSRSRPTRIPNSGSRRSSRRSTSANASASPAHAFLSSWSRDGMAAEQAAESKPDDEGQAIGLNNEYIIGRQLNHGGFGVVKEVHTIAANGERAVRAVKIVRKQIPGTDETDNEKAQQELEHEVSIWRHLKHPHILELHAVYDSEYATFCVMDLNIGGTLFDIVRQSRGSAADNEGRKGLKPGLAKSYAYQLACALRYLHEDIRVCHRDVKLENCLVDMTAPNAETEGGCLRLCDFGLSDFLHSGDEYMEMEDLNPRSSPHRNPSTVSTTTTSSIIGTLEYASPKGLSVHRKLYETAGDVWAFGVIVYVLCTGELPFKHAMPSKTVEMIMLAEWDEDALLYAAAGGGEVRELVQGCLERDVDLRLSVGEVLGSGWFEGCREVSDRGEGDWVG